MKRLFVFQFFVSVFCTVQSFAQTPYPFNSTTFFKSPDGIYHIYLPNDWTRQALITSNIHFDLRPPDAKKADVPTAITLEVTPLGTEGAGLSARNLGERQLTTLKSSFGDKLKIFTNGVRNVSNKDWWVFSGQIALAKKRNIGLYIYEAVHNGSSYALTFTGESEEYNRYVNIAEEFFKTFMFYTADITVYKDAANRVNPSVIAEQLKNFAGVFTYKPNETYLNTVTIVNKGNGLYQAKETRRLTKEGKTHTFEAELKIEEITENEIVLATDAVSKFDADLRFGKAVYNLYRMDYGLSGQFKAKDSSFKEYGLNLLEEKPVVAKSQPPKSKDGIVKKAEPKKEPIAETPPNEQAKMEGRTYGDRNENETSNIANFGQGKVKRLSDHELQLTLTSGKYVVIKAKYNLKSKGYENDRSFLGYVDELNSFVLQADFDWTVLVNRTTGTISDRIPQLNPKNISSDKKWLYSYRNYGELEDMAGGRFMIFSITDGVKKVFEQEEGNKGKEWYPYNERWVENGVLRIEKFDAEINASYGADKLKLKPFGVCWLVFQKGKWALTNSKPTGVVSATSASTVNSVATVISTDQMGVAFKTKRAAIDFAPVFSGSILKRWQVAGSKKGSFISYKEKRLEFEFLPGAQFNAYENETIRASGTYVLATDKKSVLLKDGAHSAPMKILRLVTDLCVFVIDRDTMVCYPANSATAKVALVKRALVNESGRDWYTYSNAARNLASQQRNLLYSIQNTPLSQSADFQKIDAKAREMERLSGDAIYDIEFINSLFSTIKEVRLNTPTLIALVESDSEVSKNGNIASALTYLKTTQAECEEKEKAAIRFLNEYYN